MTIHKRGFANYREKLTSNRSKYRCELFYLCNCLSTQFLYRTDVKATFNVKDNIKDIIKNSITLIINITTLPTIFRKLGGKNHICLLSIPMKLFYYIICILSIILINIFHNIFKNYKMLILVSSLFWYFLLHFPLNLPELFFYFPYFYSKLGHIC